MSALSDFEKKVVSALQLELPYPERPRVMDGTRASARAAVLALFAGEEDPALLLTVRTDLVEKHKGQIAFPGGVEEDVDGGDPVKTALRETQEELGIDPGSVRVLGQLPVLPTVTGFRVIPIVAVLSGIRDFHGVRFERNVQEIAEIFWAPVKTLLEPGVYRKEFLRVGAVDHPIHVFQVGRHRVWGATGSMIRNLFDRLERVPGPA